jgi:hypothetical protein
VTRYSKVAYQDEEGNCLHPSFAVTKVIDKLGPMLDAPVVSVKDGVSVITPGAQAQVLAWHWVCRVCEATVPEPAER